jgi:hypothetical protein
MRLEVLVRDGSSREMRFDITGSSLLVERLRVAGATSSTAADWRARLQLEDTEVLWQKPMHLDMKADLVVKDTRPFVAVLDNLREKQGWFDDLLTVEDLAGHVRLVVDGERAVIEDAMLSGPEIGVHAKGLSTAAGPEGMLLLRWKNLSGALELAGEDKHFDIGNAQARFAAYRPGRTGLPSVSGRARAPAADVAPAAAVPDGGAQVPAHGSAAGHRGSPPAGPHRAKPEPAAASPFMDHSL